VSIPTELTLGGGRPLRGRLRVPGDKSISHRALIFAAIASGRSALTNLATGADVHATRTALERLGAPMQVAGGALVIESQGIEHWHEPDTVLDCENSGTTMRVLAGALAGRPFLSVLTGDDSLRSRPMRRVTDPLRAMGAHIDGRDDGARAPLVIRGGALRGARHELPIASAQVKSACLLAGLQASGVTEVVSPASSRDHTERMLRALGVPLTVDGLRVRIEAGAPTPFDLSIPGDPSSAAFFAVAAAITPGSDIVLEAVSCNPTRTGFVDVLRRMGADIELQVRGESSGEAFGELRVRSSALHGTTISGDEIPKVIDEIPALAVAGAFAEGVTDIRDAAELLVKESNRIGALEQELGRLGVGVEGRGDGLEIRGGRPAATNLKSHGDHRIAMAVAVAANAIDGESTVRGWRAVESSYPEFAEHLAALIGAP
jgi:3-phosphoshikimate 1-carboxyvinyltransferase